MLIVQCAEDGCLIIIDPSVAVKLCLLCAAFVDYRWWSYKYSHIVHTLLAGARFLDHINISINDCSHHSTRSIYRFLINAWCLDHCFIFVRHTFVSNLRSSYKLMALQCLFTEVIGVVCKWSRRSRIWFWQEFNPWLFIGDRFQTHLWQEQISAASLIEKWSSFKMPMSPMLYVSCPSSIVDHFHAAFSPTCFNFLRYRCHI